MNYLPNSVKIIDKHLDAYFDEDEVFVLHEKVSEILHCDIYVIKPNQEKGRNYFILLSCGMSAIRMKIPREFKKASSLAELVILLPSNWKMKYEGFKNENNYWPVRLLKELAKYPHFNNSWLAYGHTFSYSESEELSGNCKFQGAILLDSTILPKEFTEINRLFRKSIRIYSVIPLYKREIEYKIKHGTDALLNLFIRSNFSEIVDINRMPLIDL